MTAPDVVDTPPEERGDEECPHTNLQPSVDITRFQAEADEDDPNDEEWEAKALMMSVGLFCATCGMQFTAVGGSPGMTWRGPGRNAAGTVVFIPVVPRGAQVPFGLPEVDLTLPFRGVPDAGVEAVIRRAADEPQRYTEKAENEGNNRQRARAIRIALDELIGKQGVG